MPIASALCSTHRLWNLKLAASAVLTLSLAAPVAAADWLCNLSEDSENLICLADTDLRDEAAASGSGSAVTTPVSLQGNRYPLDKRNTYIIQLWAPPSGMERLEQLAQSAICFRSPGCTVTMSPGSWSIAGIPRVRTFIQR